MVSEFYPCSMLEKYVRCHICFSIYLEKKQTSLHLPHSHTCHPGCKGKRTKERDREKKTRGWRAKMQNRQRGDRGEGVRLPYEVTEVTVDQMHRCHPRFGWVGLIVPVRCVCVSWEFLGGSGAGFLFTEYFSWMKYLWASRNSHSAQIVP